MLTANKLKGEFMSKNFEIINKEINENNIIANLFLYFHLQVVECLPLENGKMSLKI